MACSSTSASLWPSSPRSCGMSTPPMTSRRPSTRACTSKPWPTLTSGLRLLAELEDHFGQLQVLGERDLDVEVLALHQARGAVAHRLDGLRLVGGVGPL